MKLRISSITEIIEEIEVFNFAVKEDESYILNGIVSHNCRCTIAPVTPDLEQVDESESIKDFETWINS